MERRSGRGGKLKRKSKERKGKRQSRGGCVGDVVVLETLRREKRDCQVRYTHTHMHTHTHNIESLTVFGSVLRSRERF
jgi:hypothetical protein